MLALRNVSKVVVGKSFAAVNKSFLSTVKYTPSHEYIKIVGDIGTVGITKHAADALGDVVYVELPSVGTKFTAGASFGSVESVKAASDVYAPVEGEVVEVNANLESNPGQVNESPLVDGWFMKLKITNPKELEKLLDEKAYNTHVENEKH